MESSAHHIADTAGLPRPKFYGASAFEFEIMARLLEMRQCISSRSYCKYIGPSHIIAVTMFILVPSLSTLLSHSSIEILRDDDVVIILKLRFYIFVNSFGRTSRTAHQHDVMYRKMVLVAVGAVVGLLVFGDEKASSCGSTSFTSICQSQRNSRFAAWTNLEGITTLVATTLLGLFRPIFSC
jgi:hypothetical protein